MDLKLTSKGQTTLPKEVREHLGVQPGDKVRYVLLPDGRVYLLPKLPASALRGILKGRANRKVVTVEDMNAAVREKAVERYLRSSKS